MIKKKLSIRRPDDFHLHLRDGEIMRAVLPYTSSIFARAVIMPNLIDPVTRTAVAEAYRNRIMAALPPGEQFIPLMTCYLTDHTDPDDLSAGYRKGVFTAAKLYPAGATTNSDSGVTQMAKIYPILEKMQEIDIPLLVHGEIADPQVDVFDREPIFIDRVLEPVMRDFPELRIVFEHLTTATAVDFVLSHPRRLGATITPHHLVISRNAIFDRGLRPHMYCLPVAKREKDRDALRKAATSGDSRFFLGTDSAPHFRSFKECNGGKAGIFNTPTAMAAVIHVFEECNALAKLEAFVSVNGAQFYGLPANDGKIVFCKKKRGTLTPDEINVKDSSIIVFKPNFSLNWDIISPGETLVGID